MQVCFVGAAVLSRPSSPQHLDAFDRENPRHPSAGQHDAAADDRRSRQPVCAGRAAPDQADGGGRGHPGECRRSSIRRRVGQSITIFVEVEVISETAEQIEAAKRRIRGGAGNPAVLLRHRRGRFRSGHRRPDDGGLRSAHTAPLFREQQRQALSHIRRHGSGEGRFKRSCRALRTNRL